MKQQKRHPVANRDPCTPFWEEEAFSSESACCDLALCNGRVSVIVVRDRLPLTEMKAITSGWVITGPRVISLRSQYKSSRQPPSLRERRYTVNAWQTSCGSGNARRRQVCVCAGYQQFRWMRLPFVMQMRVQSACLYLWRQTVLWETLSCAAPVCRNCVCRMPWWKADV